MKTVVFGTGRLSSLARYCLDHDSDHSVCAFTVDREYLDTDHFESLPVLPFEDIATLLHPREHQLLLPFGYRQMNGLRELKFRRVSEMGFKMVTYISSRACVWPDLEIGQNCMIYENATVQPFSHIGDNVIVRSAAHLSHDCVVGDHSFVAAAAALAGSVSIGKNCFIGINATIRDGVSIADRCFVGAGAVVTADTEANGLYVGVPARRVGEVDEVIGS